MSIIKSRRGGVTILQCIILTGLLLFSGVIIDAVRIMLAEKEVQSAVNTTARSVLAHYDEELAGDYGLFALDTASNGNSMRNEFLKYLAANLQANKKGFSLIKYSVDNPGTSVCGYRNILSNDDNVFKEQIMEYMKYRAPLNTTKNVIDKLTSSGIFKKKEFAVKEKAARDSSRDVKANTHKLNNSIKSVNDIIADIGGYTINDTNGREYMEKLNTIKANYMEADTIIETAIQDLNRYIVSAEEAKRFAESANQDEMLKGEAEIKVYGNEFDAAEDSMNKKKSEVLKGIQSIDAHLSMMEPLQNEVERLREEISALRNANGTDTEGSSENKNGSNDDAVNQSNRMLLDLQAQMNEKLAQINGIKSSFKYEALHKVQLEEAQNIPGEAPREDKDKSSLKLTELKKRFDAYLGNRVMENAWLISSEEYDRAGWNEAQRFEEPGTRKIPVSEDDIDIAEEENNGIFAFMDKIQGVVSDGTENLYVVEYIMDRFTYHASLTERDHYFQKGEVEYILWGGASQNGNIASTVTAIGFLRLAINSIDYFATSKVPHPVFRLVYSIGKGMIQSAIDCYRLYKGESIGLCPTLNKSGFKLNYGDHLRVFLLLQAAADGEGQLNNIRQLIQVNIKNPDISQKLQRPGFELASHNTVLEAKATVKINLWFMPLLQLDKLRLPFIDGGSYVISKEINISY